MPIYTDLLKMRIQHVKKTSVVQGQL